MDDKYQGKSLITLLKDSSEFCLETSFNTLAVGDVADPVDFNYGIWKDGSWELELSKDYPGSLQERAREGRLGEDPQKDRVVQSAHLFSDSIIFLATDLSSVADMYLDWLKRCGSDLLDRHVKPCAWIVLLGDDVFNKETFLHTCDGKLAAGLFDTEELETGYFDHLVTLCARQEDIGPKWKVMSETYVYTRRLRTNIGCLWNVQALGKLLEEWSTNFTIPKPAEILTSKLTTLARGILSNLISPGDSEKEISRHAIPVISSYLARHSYISSRLHLTMENYTEEGQSSEDIGAGHVFANQQFELRYKSVADALASTVVAQCPDMAPTSSGRSVEITEMVRSSWRKLVRSMFGECESNFHSAKRHIDRIRIHRGFLSERLQIAKGNCVACLLVSWDHLLLCKHGICTLCLRACKGHELPGCRMRVHECPVCLYTMMTDYRVRYEPVTAPKRILSLDGGGVKGIIQLETLSHLITKTGLEGAVSIASFFDLIVGTSIGGICAIGLGRFGWSFEGSRDRFLTMIRGAFPPLTPFENLLTKLSNGWYRKVRNMFRILSSDSIYASADVRRTLNAAFGEQHLMIAASSENHTKIAVVTNDTSTSKSVVLATYNKTSHRRGPFRSTLYDWLVHEDHYGSLKVSDAAQATSAAPSFWAPVRLLNRMFQDGGVAHNNPVLIAQAEGRFLSKHSKERMVVVSVGCGNLVTLPLRTTSLFRRLLRSFDEAMNAERQHNDVARNIKQSDIDLIRLNIPLDQQDVQLDDVDSIPSLQRAALLAFGGCKPFYSEVDRAARLLVGSLFFFELHYDTLIESQQYHGSIRTRLSEQELGAFQSRFRDTKFMVNNEIIDFCIPAEISLPKIRKEISIHLFWEGGCEKIAGSPFTIDGLISAQHEFMFTPGCKRKRSMSAMDTALEQQARDGRSIKRLRISFDQKGSETQ